MPRYFQDRVHVCGLPVQMHRQNRLGARRDRSLNRRRIHVERPRLDIHQHRTRPGIQHRRNAGHERKRHGNDFIARPHSRCQQRQMQRARAGIQRNAPCRSTIGCEVALKRRHFRSQNKLATLQDSCDRRIDLRLDAPVLRFQIEIGNFDVCHWTCTSVMRCAKPWLAARSSVIQSAGRAGPSIATPPAESPPRAVRRCRR